MKCTSCGAEVDLIDGKCPYCGRELKETAGHRADLKKYKEKNKKIKADADEVVAKNSPMVISVVAMIVLTIGVVISAILNDNAYFFHDDALRRESEKRYDEYSQKIQAYLDAGDYTGFYAFLEAKNISELKEPYDDLKLLHDFAQEYDNMVSCVQNICLNGPEAKVYSQESNIRECVHKIDYFYQKYETESSDIENDPYSDYIYDMRDKADSMLEVYFGIDEEGREEFFNRSENFRTAYVEEVIIGEQ